MAAIYMFYFIGYEFIIKINYKVSLKILVHIKCKKKTKFILSY